MTRLKSTKSFAVTGTYHGSIVYADTEGEARRIFHEVYKGESILSCNDRNSKNYFVNLLIENDKLNNS
jgi:hypothetical protein